MITILGQYTVGSPVLKAQYIIISSYTCHWYYTVNIPSGSVV